MIKSIPPSIRKRRNGGNKGVVIFIDDDGEKKVLPPSKSLWYNLYCKGNNSDLILPKFHAKFRRRFRLPYEQFLEIVAMASVSPILARWHPGNTDAIGAPCAPIELLVLASPRYIGRGWTFDDLEECTAISEEVLRVFFHRFIEFGGTTLFDKYVTSILLDNSLSEEQILERANDLTKEFTQAGFNGCIGSTDACHVASERISNNVRQSHLSFKLPYTSRTYNMTVSHRRKILCTTTGHPARWNDKTLITFDELACALLQEGKGAAKSLQKFPFWLYGFDKDGHIEKQKYKGAWLIVDNGFQAWVVLVPPSKVSISRKEIRWSQWLESLRKDVECAFGILKGRWRVLKAGVRVHGTADADFSRQA